MKPTDILVKEALEKHGRSRKKIAQETGLTCDQVRHALDRMKPILREELPSPLPTVEELIEAKKTSYNRLSVAMEARKLIPVAVLIDGPVAIAHLGDPHIDDDGCNIALLEHHVNVINATQGMFAANVGDSSNNWCARLAHLYGEQSATLAEAQMLVEWLLSSTDWLYLIGGNHDIWSRGTDLMRWMLAQSRSQLDEWGARIDMVFPNGKHVRVNARHDFRGRSQTNVVHGPVKAAMMGWRDHILIAGHTHTSGHYVTKDPSTGLISHCLRVAGYKAFDSFALKCGFPNHAISPAVVTIIDPQYADDDPRLITTLYDVEEGAEYLSWKRSRM